ncbi:MAG TPA: hypothetical protein VLM85_13185 [Polyangiaceae bacterium]|nr:hypothetical protein [Polyangiaceae bacterium]
MTSRDGGLGVFGVALVALSLVACGSHTQANPDGGDAAGPVDDSGTPAACLEAGPVDDSGNASSPSGTQLQAGAALSVRGVTSDGYLIYSDDDALTLHALALAGGQPQDLGALGAKFWVNVVGDVVFSWSNVTGDVGALGVWSAKTGLHAISPASVGIVATASGDQILYTDHVGANGTGDVYLANVDGSGAVKLLSGVYVDPCFPQMGFAGSTAVVSYCPVAPPQSGAPNAIVSSFASPAFARVDLATNAINYWSTDGTHVLTSLANGIIVVPIGGGAPMTLDANGFLGTFGDNGQAVFYSTHSGAFRRSPPTTPSPVTLVPSGFGGPWGMSPDQKWLLYFSNFGAGGTDIYLTSAAAPSTITTLWPAATGAVVGDAFTADSSHALYITSMDPCISSGTLHATVPGGSDAVLGQGVFAEHAIGGARVVFSDAYAITGGLRFGRADIELVDLAQSPTPTKLVSRADVVFGLSPAADQLIYSWSVRSAEAGIYVVPVK